MKKFCITLAVTLAVVQAAAGQAALHRRGDTIGVHSEGRELVTITHNERGGGVSLSAGGFTIDLDGRNPRYRFDNHNPHHPADASHKPHGKGQWEERGHRSRPSRSFTMGNFRFGFTNLSDPDYSKYDGDTWNFMDLNVGKSISVSFEGAFNFPLYRDGRTWFSLGLRPRWNNYTFSEQITIVKHEGMIYPRRVEDMRRCKKSKLSTFSFDIPLMFEARPAKRLSVAGGLYGGMTLGDRTKMKFDKVKDKGDFGINFFTAGLSARVQYRNIGVFAEYSLTPLFKYGVGPKTHPFTIGLILW